MLRGVIYMNKKGFTLVELIATIAVLGIIVSISIYAANGGFSQAKDKSEEVFIKTLKDAISIYTDSDGKKLSFSTTETCTIDKRFGKASVYKNTGTVTLRKVIESEYTPLQENEVKNPADENAVCNLNATISIYRDEDFVYYYRVSKNDLGCLKQKDGYITNLPSGCLE